MAEWLKAHAWKACVRETVPWVRIPLSPPAISVVPVSSPGNVAKRPNKMGPSRGRCRTGGGRVLEI